MYKNLLLRTLLPTFSLALIVSCIWFTTSVHAASCGDIGTSVIDCSGANDSNDSPVLAILVVAIQILTGVVGVVAIGAFIFAGVIYSSASGNTSQVTKAKEIIRNTVIGLAIFAAMALLLNYLIPGGLFTGTAKFGAGGNGSGSILAGSSSTSGSGSSSDSTVETPVDPEKVAATFSVASYNILASDKTAWDSKRSNAILGFLKSVDATGIQEGRVTSMQWLTPRMKSAGYDVTSNKWARNVFWKTSKFTRLKEGEKKLPNSKDLIWVKLREKTSSKTFYIVTIHLNVLGESMRLQELRSALPYIKSTLDDAPIIFLGDMNSERGSAPDKLIQSNGFKDSYDIASSKKNMTYRTTVKNFTGGLSGTIDTSSDHQIDHIYVKGDILVNYIEIKAQKGSDHLPIQATIVLPK